MNREHEFRGFDSREWRYGDLEYNRKDDVARIHTYKDDGSYNKQYLVDPYTVGEFTGMKDSHGNKVFEGDIVCKRDLTFKTELVGVVVYNSAIGCFSIHSESKGITTRTGFEASDVYNDGRCTVPVKYNYEVIGNIYENTELLSTK